MRACYHPRMPGRLHLGTSGFVYRDWKIVLYSGVPSSRWLAHYAKSLPSVELNGTFYRLARREAVKRWAAATPDDFSFAAKGSRFLTHMKRLTDHSRGLRRFYTPLAPLKHKLAVVLWQLPPNWKKPDLERLDAFLADQPRGLRQAVEFRDESWYDEQVCRVLERRGAAFCEHDLIKKAPPRLTGGFRYIRFHGPGTHKYHGRYGRETLQPYARSLRASLARGVDAFVYFNNDFKGAALYDARELAVLLGHPLRLALP